MVPVVEPQVRRLPDLCLLALFAQMALEDRLSAHKVNSRWGQLVREASRPVRSLTVAITVRRLGQKNIERRTNSSDIGTLESVKLLRKEDGRTCLYPLHRLTKWNCLQFTNRTLDSAKVEQLLDIFFAPTELAFFIESLIEDNRKECEHLLEMLHRWRHQLTTFKLFGRLRSSSSMRVVNAINGLCALRYLTIKFHGLLVSDLRILAQLKEVHFHCVHQKSMAKFVRSLNRHASGNADLRVFITDTNLEDLNKLNADLCDRIARLSYFLLNNDSICNRFRSLTSLSLGPVAPSAHLFADLSTLDQLVHLNLNLKFTKSFGKSKRPDGQLKSVKALDLSVSLKSHSQLDWLNLSWTVPNVEALHLGGFACKACRVSLDVNHRKQCLSEADRKCLCSVFQILHQTGLPLCRIIYAKGDGEFGTAEELLLPSKV